MHVSSGTGPDGRVTKKDIDSFVPSKVAPVSSTLALLTAVFSRSFSTEGKLGSDLGKRQKFMHRLPREGSPKTHHHKTGDGILLSQADGFFWRTFPRNMMQTYIFHLTFQRLPGGIIYTLVNLPRICLLYFGYSACFEKVWEPVKVCKLQDKTWLEQKSFSLPLPLQGLFCCPFPKSPKFFLFFSTVLSFFC